jgi:hypothetical protein
VSLEGKPCRNAVSKPGGLGSCGVGGLWLVGPVSAVQRSAAGVLVLPNAMYTSG